MSRVTQIDIHFTTNSGATRVATIIPKEEKGRNLKRMFPSKHGMT